MMNSLKGQGIVVVGGQWGDEGKGRIVDSLADYCDVVVRFQGGNNAGHSIYTGKCAQVLHLIPCGIMRPDKICIIGNGVVVDPEVLFQEISVLEAQGIACSPSNLRIAKNAHIILPFHRFIDAKREDGSLSHIGTTKRGIGPCYEDKVARFGITARDLLSDQLLRTRLANVFDNRGLEDESNKQAGLSFDEIFFKARSFGQKLAPFLCDTGQLVDSYFREGRRILFEGAQGSLLDVDHGTYPFVTSSNCVAAQASIGSGVGMGLLDEVLMVSKAYCTRVGDGPFFTEASAQEQERFRKLGNEFGATTGRPRRCGWLDLPALKYAKRINGATGLVLTKLDILAGLGSIKIGTSYACDGKKNLTFLEAAELHSWGRKIEISYMDLPSVEAMPSSIGHLSDLPHSFRQLCSVVEEEVGIPIRMISYGRERGQEFWIDG
jgi:adenylosuccinate synthase